MMGFGDRTRGYVRRGGWNWLEAREETKGREPNMRRSFKTLHASHDKRVVGGGHEVRLAREGCCVLAINQD